MTPPPPSSARPNTSARRVVDLHHAVRPDLARPLPDELTRQRIIDALASRWNVTVLLVEAPGGYGKSTALAQAIRDNDLDPSGYDVYVRCRPRHWNPLQLGALILDALDSDADPTGLDPSGLVNVLESELARFSPNSVCLHLDDVHTIADSTDAVKMIATLISHLPSNAHLVIAGRSLPHLPVSRLTAADEVIRLSVDDLAFNRDEIAELAARHTLDSEQFTALSGWPAMTRLAIVAGVDASADFVIEEIVGQLSNDDRRTVAATAMAGRIDAALLSEIDLDDLDLDDLVARVPLLERTDDDGVRAHDLWGDLIGDLVDDAERDHLVEAIVPWLSSQVRHDDAVRIATNAGLWDVARAAVLASLASADVQVSTTVTSAWLARFPSEQLDEPELLYLTAVTSRLRDGPGHGDIELARARELFEANGNAIGEALALVETGMRGWLVNDMTATAMVLGHAPRVIAAGGTLLASLDFMVGATVAEFSGDFALAMETYSAIDVESMPRGFAEISLRAASTMAFLAGDGPRGVREAERVVALDPSDRNRFVLTKAQFQNNDPSTVLESWATIRDLEVGNLRDDFLISLFVAMIDASFGIAPRADRVERLSWDRSRERCFVALARAAAATIAGNEASAAREFEDRVIELGLDDVLAEGELRRFLPYAYVLSPAARDHFDRTDLERPLGPLQLERRALASIVVALRSDEAPDWAGYVGPVATLCALPLPWSVEVACGLIQHDRDAGIDLADYLLDVASEASHRALRAAADSDRPSIAKGAATILASLPKPPTDVTRIQVCGELNLVRGSLTESPRRSRVRQLLALLVLRRSVRRDQIVSLLWPGMEPQKARQNLATTLTHLRRALEPDRERGEPTYHLRERGDRIMLHGSAALTADAWDITEHLDAAAEHEAAGRRPAAIDSATEAFERWSPHPFVDLADIAGVTDEVAAFDLRALAAGLEVAEWQIAHGSVDDGATFADRILQADPWNERAHGVLIGSHLAAGELPRAKQAIDECLAALADCGVTPGASTLMLVRRYERRLEPNERSAAG